MPGELPTHGRMPCTALNSAATAWTGACTAGRRCSCASATDHSTDRVNPTLAGLLLPAGQGSSPVAADQYRPGGIGLGGMICGELFGKPAVGRLAGLTVGWAGSLSPK